MGLIKIPEKSLQFFKDNLDEIFSSGTIAEGPWNEKINEYVSKMTGAKKSVTTNSNGAGLVALISLYRHYHSRKKVLIQTNTMYGVKAMIGAAGCKQAGFIDCQLNTLMPSLDDVKNSIINYTRQNKNELIIMLSHIGGIINPHIEDIADLCKNENIILLEDCAHSFGSTLNGKHSGLYGDAGVYSFYATKAIPAGEGGVVVTNNMQIGEMVADFAIYDRFKQELEIGNNIRISEVQALLTFSIIKEWKSIIQDKKYVAEKYINMCIKNKISFISQNNEDNIGNYYKFIIYSENESASEAFPNLKTKTSPVYDYSIGVENHVANKHFCLPIWYGQDKSIVDQVITELSL